MLSEKLKLAKISDLGRHLTCRLREIIRKYKNTKYGHLHATEVLSDEPAEYGAVVDVFSFGCVMLHTLSHQLSTPSQPVGTQSEVERCQKYLDVIAEQRETPIN